MTPQSTNIFHGPLLYLSSSCGQMASESEKLHDNTNYVTQSTKQKIQPPARSHSFNGHNYNLTINTGLKYLILEKISWSIMKLDVWVVKINGFHVSHWAECCWSQKTPHFQIAGQWRALKIFVESSIIYLHTGGRAKWKMTVLSLTPRVSLAELWSILIAVIV